MALTIDTKTAAVRSGRARRTIQLACRNGEIPAQRLGGSWVMTENDLFAWLSALGPRRQPRPRQRVATPVQ